MCVCEPDQKRGISIHAPARGATWLCRTAPAGLPSISIHAPARGATRNDSSGYRKHTQFQSTLPRGERLKRYASSIRSDNYFNPRSREGSDMHLILILLILTYFNPRSREGSDQNYTHVAGIDGISIHAPARGATVCTHMAWSSIHQISIHAPARGATSIPDIIPSAKSISIHAPARGATFVHTIHSTFQDRFQSTLPRGERHPHSVNLL